MKKLLLIEDDDTFAILLAAYFETAGSGTERASSAAAALKQIERESWDAVIVDLNLPDEDGIVLTRLLRARSSVPIIVVTARSASQDKLVALEIGADDFITKPFDPRELILRLNNLLRRSDRATIPGDTRLECAGGELDLNGRMLLTAQGEAVELSSSEFGLLSALTKGRDRVLTRAQLIDTIAGSDPPESERAIDILVSRLRKKMSQTGLDASRLRTVRGYGYKLESAPKKRSSDDGSSPSKAWT